jgi:hypothetical protein
MWKAAGEREQYLLEFGKANFQPVIDIAKKKRVYYILGESKEF